MSALNAKGMILKKINPLFLFSSALVNTIHVSKSPCTDIHVLCKR